jgi:cytochrome b561
VSVRALSAAPSIMMRNTGRTWGSIAKLLHWVVATLVVVQIALGFVARGYRLSPTKLDLFVWHKSTGLLILALMLVRIAWRLANPVPALPPGSSPLERHAARASHLFLYLLLLLIPMSGWIVNSAANIPFRMYWQIPVPALVAPDKATADAAAGAHLALAIALCLLVAGHIAAALRHHFGKRDDVLVRMLPWTERVR